MGLINPYIRTKSEVKRKINEVSIQILQMSKTLSTEEIKSFIYKEPDIILRDIKKRALYKALFTKL